MVLLVVSWFRNVGCDFCSQKSFPGILGKLKDIQNILLDAYCPVTALASPRQNYNNLIGMVALCSAMSSFRKKILLGIR